MIRETFIFYALLLYVCFLFLHWVKFVVVVLNRFFFFIVRQKRWSLVALNRWLSYKVTIVWKFAWVDSALVV